MCKKNVIWYQTIWYQNDRAKLTAALLWNTREIELYTELYIVSGREFKRRQRSILSRRGNTLDENQLVWDCLLPRWHWQQNPFISQIGIYPHGLGGCCIRHGVSQFYIFTSSSVSKRYDHMTLKSRSFAKREQPRSCFMYVAIGNTIKCELTICIRSAPEYRKPLFSANFASCELLAYFPPFAELITSKCPSQSKARAKCNCRICRTASTLVASTWWIQWIVDCNDHFIHYCIHLGCIHQPPWRVSGACRSRRSTAHHSTLCILAVEAWLKTFTRLFDRASGILTQLLV